jgi:beta-lactamase class A
MSGHPACARPRTAALLLTILAILCCGTVSARETGLDRKPLVVAELERHAEALGVAVGLSAVHLPSGQRLTLNADSAFPLASTYKVPMAAYALKLVDDGRLSTDELVTIEPTDLVISSSITQLFPHPGIRLSLANLLEATLIRSDNTATDVLLKTVGGASAVSGWLAAEGIRGLRVDRSTAELIRDYMEMAIPAQPVSMATQYRGLAEDSAFDHLNDADWSRLYRQLRADPRDQGTPAAMTELLTRIWQGSLLSPASSTMLREIMGRCLTGSARLPARLPEQALPIAHKTGTLGGSANDVGAFELPDGRGTVVISVYAAADSTRSVAAAERAIAEIGRTIYDYFLFAAPFAATSTAPRT